MNRESQEERGGDGAGHDVTGDGVLGHGGFEQLEGALRALSPATAATSATEMMYRCGYAAGRAAVAEESVSRPKLDVVGMRRSGLALLCAAMIGACLVGPWAFWWGRRDVSGEMLAGRMEGVSASGADGGGVLEASDQGTGSAVSGTNVLDAERDDRPGVGGEREPAAWERFLIFEAWFERDLNAPVTAGRTRVLTSGDALQLSVGGVSDIDGLSRRGRLLSRREVVGRVGDGLGVGGRGERKQLTTRPDLSQFGDWLP